MPAPRGNMPSSTGSNYNQAKANKPERYAPKRNKKAMYRKGGGRKAKVDNMQSAVINKLSRQVHKLQMQRYGKVQQNFQSLQRALVPTGAAPICLDLNDLTCDRANGSGVADLGGRIYQHTTGTNLAAASYWERNTTVQENVYWKGQNEDAVDTGSYLHLNSSYFVDVRGVPNLDNTRVRFDVIAQKPNAIIPKIEAGTAPQVLPWTLGAMKHLAEPHRNRINPTYFKKYFSKTVFLNSSKTDSNTKGTTANIQRFSFTIRPKKVVYQQETNPPIQDVPIIDPVTGDIGQQVEITFGNFGPFNVPATQPLWLVISTDDQTSLGDRVEIRMSRRCVWRDTIGSANL